MKIGYIRVSTPDQNIDRQLNGFEVDKKFVDKASASNKNRRALAEMINFIREGDSVHVWSIDCLLYTSPSPRDTPQSRMPSSA